MITLIIIACIVTLPINHLIRRILFAVVDLLAVPFVGGQDHEGRL